MKLSAIILSKNAENLLVDCLESIDFADEIILVDDHSTDRTVELAKKFGAKVVEDTSQSFAEKRNKGLHQAKGEWVFYIDTDERVDKTLRESIRQAVEKGAYDAYKIQRKNFYLGNYPWPKIEQLERLFKRSRLEGWYGQLHESPILEGKTGMLEGFLLHYTHRDLSSMVAKTNVWSDAEAKLRLDAHHPKMTWWRFPRVMLTAFIDSYILQQGYKAGTMGLVESMYQAFSMFVTYAKLWELQQKK